MPIYKVCISCGNSFAKRGPRQKYCGDRDKRDTCAFIARRRLQYRYRMTRKTLPTYKAPPTKEQRLREKILIRDNNTCQICSLQNTENSFFDLDHKDGNKNNNAHDNLWILCPNCHRIKTIQDRKNIIGGWKNWKGSQTMALVVYQPKAIQLFKV